MRNMYIIVFVIQTRKYILYINRVYYELYKALHKCVIILKVELKR